MEESVIITKELSLKTGHRYLLNRINWNVKKGEHWLIFGENGCGKTTLLSILAGFKQPSSGTAKVLGQEYNADNILEIRRKIGWVSASFFDQQYSKESVLDIVLSGKFGTLGLAMDIQDEDIKKAKVLLKHLHLADKIYHPFHLMSKGERQNVLIARALIGNPEILLLDEPCTGLDITAREYLLNTVKDITNHTAITVIYVTHHTDEILTDVFQQTMLLDHGCVYAQGATESIFNQEIISEFFGVNTEVRPGSIRGFETRVGVNSSLSQFIKAGGSNDRFA